MNAKGYYIILNLFLVISCYSQNNCLIGKWYYSFSDSLLDRKKLTERSGKLESFFSFNKNKSFSSVFGDYSETGVFKYSNSDSILLITKNNETINYKLIEINRCYMILQENKMNEIQYLYFQKKSKSKK